VTISVPGVSMAMTVPDVSRTVTVSVPGVSMAMTT
jgi:hypothetical protein